MRLRVTCLLLLILCLLPRVSVAQAPTVITATSGVSLTDSGHNATDPISGVPLISRYEIHFAPTAGCAAVPVANLGKPTPDASGVITVKPLPAFATLPANCVYTLVFAAIGPGGEADSPSSLPFVLDQPAAPTAPAKPVLLP